MRRISLVISAFALASLFAACSSDDGGSTCAASEDCPRGLSCQPDGTCGEFACSSSADCLQTGEFQEACLQENSAGAHDPTRPGVCSDEECRSDRDCDGGVCMGRICYQGTAAPIACTCRGDCPSGQACIRGECSAPLGACSDTCECAVGQVCEGGRCTTGTDPCDGITCEAGETCVEGVCTGPTSCNPPCGAGQVCNEATATCEADNSGNLCSSCTSHEQCGGEGDACVTLGTDGVSICGQSCDNDTNPCPDGYSCLPVDSRVGSQCIPSGGSCAGCLVTPCPAGQYCNAASTECEDIGETCDSCAADAGCADGSVCARLGGQNACLPGCTTSEDCGAGSTCQSLSGKMACAPDAGCGSSCSLDPADCVAPLAVLDPSRCICVGCVDTSDCPDGRVCTSGGNCVSGGRPCSTTAECDGGYCQGGVCVECLTPGDCGPEELCVAGACEACTCPEGQRCDSAGNCVEVPDPSSCTSDSQCVRIARDLGFSGEGATCDSTIGCYTIGVCNGSGGGGGLPDLGFGGSTDPFNAPCPAGTTCGAQLDIFSGSFFTFSCVGCTVGDASTCREGETCAAPLIDLLMTGPACGGGGGGSPFPFPFP